jgi:glutathione S-transferase
MPEIILHQYGLSPFSEKIRRIFAYKGLTWRGVEQPLMAPKPALTPLTGGYRRIPVLQIGADIYCDTWLIARVIERLFPSPSCIPAAASGNMALLEDWADHRFFMQAVPPVLVDLLPALPPEFLHDRSAMSPGFSQPVIEAAAPHALAQTLQSLDRLEEQLRTTPFLLGDQFSLADAACFHCVWFLKNSPRVFAAVQARAGVAGWVRRIEEFAADTTQLMTTADALAIATAATPQDVSEGCVADPELKAGQTVTVIADDYGKESTTGRLVQLSAQAITVLRADPQVGEVAVHYPRAGYRVNIS